jgi:hypothetical protein
MIFLAERVSRGSTRGDPPYASKLVDALAAMLHNGPRNGWSLHLFLGDPDLTNS